MIDLQLGNAPGATVLAADVAQLTDDQARGWVLYSTPDGAEPSEYATGSIWKDDEVGEWLVFGFKAFADREEAMRDYDNRRGAVPLPFHREETAGVSRD